MLQGDIRSTLLILSRYPRRRNPLLEEVILGVIERIITGDDCRIYILDQQLGEVIILDEDGTLYLTTVTPDYIEIHSKVQLCKKQAWTPSS